MFNQSGMVKTDLVNVRQILGNEHYMAVSAIIDNTAKNSDGMCLAGTPITGDLLKRGGGTDAFTKAATTGDTGAQSSNAKFVLLHDVVFDGTNDANGTVLIHGVVQKTKCDSTVQTLLTAPVITALAANGIYVI